MIDIIARIFLKDGSTAAQKRTVYGYVCGIVGIILNLFLFAAKLIIGTVSGSISITADAFNNFSDAGSSIITVFGFMLSGRKADKDHPFGHGRIEYICGILVSVIIIIVGGELFLSSAEKIFSPSEVTFSLALCIVLAISVLVKFYMYFYNMRCGKKIGSETLKAVASDSIGDCVATLAVLVCSVISLFSPPMTPATPTGFSASAITSIPVSSSRRLPSSVLKTSPSRAVRTTMAPPSRQA